MATQVNFEIYFKCASSKQEEDLWKEFIHFFPFTKDIAKMEDGCCYLIAKWYHFIDAIDTISKKFPEVFFEIYGEGADDGNKFRMYVRNGCCQVEEAIITYGEYDPNKMKPIVI